MWEFTLVRLEVIGVHAPKTSTGTARAENPFFRVLAKKIVGAVPVKSEGAVMEITVLIQKGCSGKSTTPQHLN